MNLLDKGPLIGIIVGVIAAIVLVAIIILIVALHKKTRTAADKATDDREQIETNAKAVEALIVLAEGDEQIVGELKQLQEQLKYLVPSTESKVFDYDKKIKNLIGDLRIALTKSDGEMSKKAAEIVKDLKLAVADRNTRL